MDERAAQEERKGLATRRREAFERTLLARERSLSAWMRTGLASIAGGFVIAKLAGPEKPAWLAVLVGAPLVMAGATIVALGFWNFRGVAMWLKKEGVQGVPLWAIGVMSVVIVVCALGAVVLLLL